MADKWLLWRFNEDGCSSAGCRIAVFTAFMFHANVESEKTIQEEVEKDPIGKEPRPAAQPALFHFLALPRAPSLPVSLCFSHRKEHGRGRRQSSSEAEGPQPAAGRGRSVGRSLRWTWHCLARVEGRKEVGGCLARGCKKKALTAVRRPRAVGPQPSLPAKYHKEAEEEEGRDSLDISTAAAASALVSLAANQPAGNLALRAPRESEQGKKRGDRQSYGQTERYTCRTPQTRVRRRGGEEEDELPCT